MTDAALTAVLVAAFLPYARAFADDPASVRITVVCTQAQVKGTLTYSAADFALVHQGSMTEVDIGRAFRVLSHWNDPRGASLVIESA